MKSKIFTLVTSILLVMALLIAVAPLRTAVGAADASPSSEPTSTGPDPGDRMFYEEDFDYDSTIIKAIKGVNSNQDEPWTQAQLDKVKTLNFTTSVDISSGIGYLVELTSLSMYNPQSIPEEIGSLTKLMSFTITAGSTIAIPESIENLKSLATLSITGALGQRITIPAVEMDFSSLTTLKLQNVILDFAFFDSLNNTARSLTTVSLSQNPAGNSIPLEQISGSCGFPLEFIESNVNLTSILISLYDIGGNMPNLGKLTSLKTCSITLSNIKGELELESEGSLPTSLTLLALQNNCLEGPIPESIKYLTKLGSINLGYNEMSGDLNFELFYGMPNLTTLDLGPNRFTGSLPDDCESFLQQLNTLNLQLNQLSGPIPALYGEISFSGTFSLSQNRFSGELPDTFYNNNANKVGMLNIAGNLLTGKLEEIKHYRNVYAYYNFFDWQSESNGNSNNEYHNSLILDPAYKEHELVLSGNAQGYDLDNLLGHIYADYGQAYHDSSSDFTGYFEEWNYIFNSYNLFDAPIIISGSDVISIENGVVKPLKVGEAEVLLGLTHRNTGTGADNGNAEIVVKFTVTAPPPIYPIFPTPTPADPEPNDPPVPAPTEPVVQVTEPMTEGQPEEEIVDIDVPTLPLASEPEEEEVVIIEEEEIALSDLPKTGDDAAIFFSVSLAVSLIIAMCFVVVGKGRRNSSTL